MPGDVDELPASPKPLLPLLLLLVLDGSEGWGDEVDMGDGGGCDSSCEDEFCGGSRMWSMTKRVADQPWRKL
jgi:hypothetical protein